MVLIAKDEFGLFFLPEEEFKKAIRESLDSNFKSVKKENKMQVENNFKDANGKEVLSVDTLLDLKTGETFRMCGYYVNKDGSVYFCDKNDRKHSQDNCIVSNKSEAMQFTGTNNNIGKMAYFCGKEDYFGNRFYEHDGMYLVRIAGNATPLELGEYIIKDGETLVIVAEGDFNNKFIGISAIDSEKVDFIDGFDPLIEPDQSLASIKEQCESEEVAMYMALMQTDYAHELQKNPRNIVCCDKCGIVGEYNGREENGIYSTGKWAKIADSRSVSIFREEPKLSGMDYGKTDGSWADTIKTGCLCPKCVMELRELGFV